MMNQQPDKLFRDKLQVFQKPVPSNTWTRIAEPLHKKSNRDLWFKIAASFVLLTVATFLLFPIQHKPVHNTISEKAISSKKEELPKSKEITLPSKPLQPFLEQKKNSLPATPGAGNKITALVKKKNIIPVQQPETNNKKVLTGLKESDPVITPDISEPENAFTLNEPHTEQAGKKGRGVTLIYSAKEVNEKYLNKNALVEATTEDKKPSTLRKLLDKAYDLKHNQVPLGDLRLKKNEILALNFKSDKQRNQNK